MAMGLDDYIFCSPFLSVASLDSLIDRPGDENQPFDVADPQPHVEEQIDTVRAHDTIHGAVDGLPPRQRLVVHAIFFAGYTVTQTAKLMKISAAAVVKLRTKALKHLLNVLMPQREALLA